MQEQPNDRLEFAREIEFIALQFKLVDAHDNTWSIYIAGVPDLVKELADKRAIYAVASPLTPKEANELVPRWEKSPAQETSSEIPQVGLPSLQVTMTLEKLAIAPPYVASFHIDPRLTLEFPTFQTVMTLYGEDTTANVNCEASAGTVYLMLAGPVAPFPAGPSTNPAISVPNVTKGSSWTVTVQRDSGTPEFILRGDIVVN